VLPPQSYGISITFAKGQKPSALLVLLFSIKQFTATAIMSTSKGSILVTGTNGGLGSAIVADILNKPELASSYTGLYTVRKAATATRLQKILSAAPKSHKHNVINMDLSSLASVRTTAAEINRQVAAGDLPPIKVLILNAGYQDHEQIVSNAPTWFKISRCLLF
jgi:NAD(P)-dependent dehydrogenase (short-subunit alcohol dehydrogenase family)